MLKQTINVSVLLMILLMVCPLLVRADRVDDFILEQMRAQNIPGLSLAVVRGDKIIKVKGYGFADVEHNVAASPDTVYEIGSITKQFTAVAVMLLVEDGKVAVDDSLRKHLTEIPENWKSITIRQLMNQTSGLKDYYDSSAETGAVLIPALTKDILGTVARESLAFEPGAGWGYSNTNHYLLGLLIERAGGKPFGEFLRERIFTPLGMTQTRINDRKLIVRNRARGYQWDWTKGELRNSGYTDPSWAFAAGGLVSTVNDLAKWNIALDGDLLITAKSKRLMWTAGKLKSGVSHRYGFGWYVDRVNGKLNVSHGGDIPGFASYTSKYPDDKLSVVVSLNQYVYPKRIADTVAAIYLPELVYREIPDEEPQFTELIRRLYLNRADGKFNLWEEKLFAPELWKSLRVSLADVGNTDFYKRLGAPKDVTLVERISGEYGVTVRFRIKYQNNARIARFLRDASGKVVEWEDYEE